MMQIILILKFSTNLLPNWANVCVFWCESSLVHQRRKQEASWFGFSLISQGLYILKCAHTKKWHWLKAKSYSHLQRGWSTVILLIPRLCWSERKIAGDSPDARKQMRGFWRETSASCSLSVGYILPWIAMKGNAAGAQVDRNLKAELLPLSSK